MKNLKETGPNPSLVDPLLRPDGSRVKTGGEWAAQRAVWQDTIARWMLGDAPADVSCEGRVVASHLLYEGRAVLETVRIAYGPGLSYSFDAGIVRPNRDGCFPAITWNLFETPFEAPCPVEREAIERGYILAGFDKTRLMHDQKGDNQEAREAYPGHGWGAIRVWAFGHSLLATYLLTRPEVDGQKLVAAGHSRGGKAALAAAAYDERFAVCAANNSGAGGAGCFRILGDRHGQTGDESTVESMARVGQAFPHWWNEAFFDLTAEATREPEDTATRLPFDLHILKSLVAPRGLITSEGLMDTWANPYGTYRTWKAAQPVFDLLGAPERNVVHYREGGHGFLAADWLAVLDFCDTIFFEKRGTALWNNPPYDR